MKEQLRIKRLPIKRYQTYEERLKDIQRELKSYPEPIRLAKLDK